MLDVSQQVIMLNPQGRTNDTATQLLTAAILDTVHYSTLYSSKTLRTGAITITPLMFRQFHNNMNHESERGTVGRPVSC